MPLFTALDYETRYDTERSVTKQGNRGYASILCDKDRGGEHDDIYMLSAYNPKIGRWAGLPDQFDWESVRDSEFFVHHNAGFDWAMTQRLVELGRAPEWVLEKPVYCTADLCVYHYYARSLNGAVFALFGENMDKGIRNWMKGKTWQDAVAEGKDKELLEYADADAYWCWKIWDKLGPTFPESEIGLSVQTREMTHRGFPFDMDTAREWKESLSKKLFEARGLLEYTEEINPKYNKPYEPGSLVGLAMQCEKVGIPCPSTTSKEEDEYVEWVEAYGKTHAFVNAFKAHAEINTLIKKIDSMIDKAYLDSDGNWWVSYSLKYAGAWSTLRWSGGVDGGAGGKFVGGGSLNIQNFPREAKYGCELRNLIKARDGRTFVIIDLNAIEPTLMAKWLQDEPTLALLREGLNPYEAHARRTMGYTGTNLKSDDPDMYLLAKIRMLSLGYGTGWHRFYTNVKNYNKLDILNDEPLPKKIFEFGSYINKYAKDRVSEWKGLDDATKRHWVNAWIQVTAFRKGNPLITRKWRELDTQYANSDGSGFQYRLMNGELLEYFKVRPEIKPRRGRSCILRRGDKRRSFMYGAKIFENVLQREARSVFSNGLTLVNNAGYDVIMHVHDELVVEVNEGSAEDDAKHIQELMTTPPSWIGDEVPIRAEYELSKVYRKT